MKINKKKRNKKNNIKEGNMWMMGEEGWQNSYVQLKQTFLHFTYHNPHKLSVRSPPLPLFYYYYKSLLS